MTNAPIVLQPNALTIIAFQVKVNAMPRVQVNRPDSRGRKTKGLYPQVSRNKLAAEVGASVQYVSRILLGHHDIKGFGLMLKIAAALGITAKQLKEDLDNARTNHQHANGSAAAPKRKARKRSARAA
jgi:hypothetical protein